MSSSQSSMIDSCLFVSSIGTSVTSSFWNDKQTRHKLTTWHGSRQCRWIVSRDICPYGTIPGYPRCSRKELWNLRWSQDGVKPWEASVALQRWLNSMVYHVSRVYSYSWWGLCGSVNRKWSFSVKKNTFTVIPNKLDPSMEKTCVYLCRLALEFTVDQRPHLFPHGII